MTIGEAISRLDSLHHNTYSKSDKITWLSNLDGLIKRTIIDTHEGGEDISFAGYDDNTDTGTQLLVSAPYEDIYLRWMESQIDYNNAEYERYNNSAAAYNSVYAAYNNYYNRTHTPNGGKIKYF